jgi:hypothetical protein
LIAQRAGDTISFTSEIPTLDKIKGKFVMILKARNDKNVVIDESNVGKEIVMMEGNRNILENLYLTCSVIF